MALYDNWTWDSANKTMTIVADDVRGGSESNPYSFSDIPDAIVAKGWNASYNESASGNQLEFDFRIVIGNALSSGATWLVDENKQITFRATAVSGAQRQIYVRLYSHIKFGVLIDADLKLTKNGVSIVALDSYNTELIAGEVGAVNADLQLYSSMFSKVNARGDIVWVTGTKIYGCILSFVRAVPRSAGQSVTLYDVRVKNLRTPLNLAIDAPVGVCEELHIYNTGYAIRLLAGWATTIKNAKLYSNQYALWASGITTHKYLINVDSDVWNVYWSGTNTADIYRQYEFEAYVQDKIGGPIANVSVTAEYVDPFGQAFSTTTDDNGHTGVHTVDYGYFRYAAGFTEKTPLKVTYSKAGFQTVVKHYPMSVKTVDRVVLHEAVAVFSDFGRPVINLKKSDPENKNVMVL